jgi:predicted O-methyltransferase YrrM
LEPTKVPDQRWRQEVFDALVAAAPSFHGWHETVFRNLALDEPALRLILDNVRPGDRTLETGVGHSTVVFALAGARHTSVAPRGLEFGRVQEWCAAHGVDTGTVTFVAGLSQDVLPALPADPLDVALVDGDHAFPIPFLDWFHAATRLRVGGLVIVDDTQIRTGALLRAFLDSEVAAGRWQRRAALERTVMFEKRAHHVLDPRGWVGQPFCALDDAPEPPSLVARARAMFRLRSRLAAARRRFTH